MPWSTPTLREVRGDVRDYIQSTLPGADANVPNSVLRVLSDSQGGLCHLTLQYIDWLALQLLPDTAETEWLDRHGEIWLVNADGSRGRKRATFASGTVTFTGIDGAPIPKGTQLQGAVGDYETTEDIIVGTSPTPASARALDPGLAGNLTEGDVLALTPGTSGVDNLATVVEMDGGVDTENDNDLRARILLRIQKPPMGGDKDDYEQWTLSIPGVTRAWCSPVEMGPGTVTVRFMMDDVRADNDGFPLPADCTYVKAYLDIVRPVAVKDLFVVAPIRMPVDMRITNLNPNTTAMINAIEASCIDMFLVRGEPGAIFYRAWVDEAIAAAGTIHYDLTLNDAIPPSKGHLPVLGTITYG